MRRITPWQNPTKEIAVFADPEEVDVVPVSERLRDLRTAARVHKTVRRHMQTAIKPGKSLLSIVQELEAKTRELVTQTGSETLPHKTAGWGFPTGVSLNHVAAHYTPNYGEAERKLETSDVMKVDFGVHVQGSIIDCAWTVAFDPQYDALLQATIEGTNAGIKAAGVDARFTEIAKVIQETIEAHEVEIKNKTHKVKAIRNLNGHSIDLYKIHGGKSVPIHHQAAVNMYPDTVGVQGMMRENEVYAIETFASTGKGYVVEEGECSHYMVNTEFPVSKKISNMQAKHLLTHIDNTFGTLPFCRRWLDDQGQARHLLPLKALVDAGHVNPYPPLCDLKGAFTSQMEHTVFVKPQGGPVEVLSRGDDY